ncbi:MAG: hypothetical protein ACM3S1_12890, partial [Hyphomicrobiales bacterium]
MRAGSLRYVLPLALVLGAVCVAIAAVAFLRPTASGSGRYIDLPDDSAFVNNDAWCHPERAVCLTRQSLDLGYAFYPYSTKSQPRRCTVEWTTDDHL